MIALHREGLQSRRVTVNDLFTRARVTVTIELDFRLLSKMQSSAKSALLPGSLALLRCLPIFNIPPEALAVLQNQFVIFNTTEFDGHVII